VFLGRAPDPASFEDVRRFQLQLAENRADTPTLVRALQKPDAIATEVAIGALSSSCSRRAQASIGHT